MVFIKFTLNQYKKNLLLLFIFFFTACQKDSDSSLKNDKNVVNQTLSLNVFDLSSDAFELSLTKESQLAVFDSLFNNPSGYQLPGNPSKSTLHAFFDDLRLGYFKKDEGIDYSHIRKEYHTFTHAMDVMITTHALLESGGAVYLSDVERASLVLAALGHDVLHTGVNNSFLIETKHPYFLELGENSLQEKRSARHVLSLMDKHGILVVAEDMDDLQIKEVKEARNLVEQSILWTDIKRHGEQMKKMEEATENILIALKKARADTSDIDGEIVGASKEDLQENVDVNNFIDVETRILIGSYILHCADISNPGKQWANCERWAVLVMNEFFSQGDLQKKLGFKPSMNCDRATVSVPACQVGFGKYVIRDLYELLSKTLHDGGSYFVNHFNVNQEKWIALEAKAKNTGSPYTMKFYPPSQEGGWTGKFRVGEE